MEKKTKNNQPDNSTLIYSGNFYRKSEGGEKMDLYHAGIANKIL